MTKKRKVFGRRRVSVGGVIFRIEMRKDAIVVRELYSRREYRASLVEIVDAVTGQLPLTFN